MPPVVPNGMCRGRRFSPLETSSANPQLPFSHQQDSRQTSTGDPHLDPRPSLRSAGAADGQAGKTPFCTDPERAWSVRTGRRVGPRAGIRPQLRAAALASTHAQAVQTRGRSQNSHSSPQLGDSKLILKWFRGAAPGWLHWLSICLWLSLGRGPGIPDGAPRGRARCSRGVCFSALPPPPPPGSHWLSFSQRNK